MTQEQINELRLKPPEPCGWASGTMLELVRVHTRKCASIYRAPTPWINTPLYSEAAILALIQQRDELLAALNSAASVSNSGGLCGYAEDDALRLVRVITLPYWDKSASNDKHRAIIAKAEAKS